MLLKHKNMFTQIPIQKTKPFLRLSLRAPERCVAISSQRPRLLHFVRNDNSLNWDLDVRFFS
jgi:hypothetical protein